MTKKILIIIILTCVFSGFLEFVGQAPVFAQNSLQQTVFDQLDNLNIYELDNIFSSFFKDFSFKEILNNLLTGNFEFSFTNFFEYIVFLFKTNLKSFIAPFITIFVICVIGYLLKHTSSEKTEKSISNIIHLGLLSLISIIIIKVVLNTVLDAKSIFYLLKNAMQICFPAVLTLMATSGAVATVSFYQPIMALLTGGIIDFFIYFLLPIFIVIIVLTVADNLTDNVKLSNISNLLLKVYKWTISLIFGLFSSLLVVFGITASSYDSISFKTAQYSIKNYIPFVGGYLSGGFNIIALSSVLIKNSLGTACLILVILTILKPIINILIIKLFLGLLSASLQNIADKKIINFCLGVSKALNMLIAIICTVCAMFLIFIGLCVVSCNVL